MKCRKSVRYASATEKQKFIDGCLALKDAALHPATIADAIADGALSRYDEYVWMHMVVGMGAHRGPAFFPWHREFLKRFESDIQNALGDPDFRLLYWDWTRDRSSGDPGWPFTAAFIGEDGVDGDDDKVATGPFAFVGGDWNLNVITGQTTEPGRDDVNYLRRRFNEDPSYLPTPTQTRNAINTTPYDSSPWDNTVSNTVSFRKRHETVNHDPVHVWVGGCMRPMTSPNDPVFFLHHCNVDRHWAIWQQKNPSLGYLPAAGGPAGHNLNDNMATFTAYFGVNVKPTNTLNFHAAGIWYDTDLPEITLETPSLSFGDVTQGITTYKPIKFKIRTCRETRIRITAGPSGNFNTTPLGTSITITPTVSEEFIFVNLWISFIANGTLNVQQNSSITVQGYIIDDEGYYAAAEGGEYIVLQNTIVPLTARPIPDLKYAIGCALDRSGSMASITFGTLTRAEVLKEAVGVFADLLGAQDGIGLVSYDHIVTRLFDISAMGPLTPVTAGSGRDKTYTTLSGNDLDPAGATSIGGGIQEARDMINDGSAGYDRTALIVITDGLENTPPMISMVSGDINSKTFAIGIGSSTSVSTDALKKITNNNDGYLLLTGNLSLTEREFLVTKYFVQILSDLSNNNIALDPFGELLINSEQKISFDITEADISMDIIALNPFPFLLDFKLETPDGKIIDSSASGTEPNIFYYTGKREAFYRIKLPALSTSIQGSHAGKWTAILKLDISKFGSLLLDDKRLASFFVREGRRALPYNLIVKTRSNIQFNVTLTQKSSEPGSEIIILAALTEYNIPVENRATVWAEIRRPDESITSINLSEYNPGRFRMNFMTTLVGVYTFRIRAAGYTLGNNPFMCEKTLTAGVSEGGDDNQFNIVIDYFRERDEKNCKLISCLFSNKVTNDEFIKHLKNRGLHMKDLMECLKEFCSKTGIDKGGESIEKLADVTRQFDIDEFFKRPEIQILLSSGKLGKFTEENPYGFAEQEIPKPIDECCCEREEHDERDHGEHEHGEHEHEEHEHKIKHDVNCPKQTKEERDAHKFMVFEVIEEEIKEAEEFDRKREEEKKKKKIKGSRMVFEISDEEEMRKAKEFEKEKRKQDKGETSD